MLWPSESLSGHKAPTTSYPRDKPSERDRKVSWIWGPVPTITVGSRHQRSELAMDSVKARKMGTKRSAPSQVMANVRREYLGSALNAKLAAATTKNETVVECDRRLTVSTPPNPQTGQRRTAENDHGKSRNRGNKAAYS